MSCTESYLYQQWSRVSISTGKRLWSCLLAFSTALILSCGSGTSMPGKTLTSIQISPDNPSVATGAKQQFTATGQYSDNTTADLTCDSWSSSNDAVAMVNSSGEASAVTIGRVQITCSSGSAKGSTTLISVIGQTPEIPHYAYVANSGDNTISGFSVNPTTGALTPIGSGPVAAGQGPVALATDPLGRFLYVANSVSNNISAYTVDPSTGALNPIAGSPFPAGQGLSSFSVDPSGEFGYASTGAYSINYGGASTWAYSINQADGSLASLGNLGSVVVVHPSGKFAYGTTGGEVVTGFTIDPETGIVGASFTVVARSVPFFAAQMMDPLGRFFYVAGRVDSSFLPPIDEYAIDPASGSLTIVPGSPETASAGIGLMVVDPAGGYIFVGTYLPTDIAVYSIDPTTGALNPTTGSPLPLGDSPSSMAFEPSGRFLYVTYPDLNSMGWFAIDPSTGTPTASGSVATGASPQSVSIVSRIQ